MQIEILTIQSLAAGKTFLNILWEQIQQERRRFVVSVPPRTVPEDRLSATLVLKSVIH
jgi:hypothetical protein